MIYPYKKLIRTGFIAVPLLAISALMPVFFQHNPSVTTISNSLMAITIIIFLLWVMNVLLVKAFEKRKTQVFRLLTSVLLTFLIPNLVFPFFDNGDDAGRHHSSGKHAPKSCKKHSKSPDILSSDISGRSHHMHKPHRFHSRPIISLIIVQMNNALILFIIALLILREKEKQVISENAQLKLMNLEAQQQQLKQQIHPHFLFNSLNNLKALIKSQPDEAEEYLIKLSSFLRVNIYSNTHNLISLEEEMLICSDYLSIQKIRFKNSLQYTVELPKEIYASKVPTFAVQFLLENAIKHNLMTDSEPLKIKISYLSENKISIANNIQAKQINDAATGMGLKNLTERYKLLTDKMIEIKRTENTFEVILPLL